MAAIQLLAIMVQKMSFLFIVKSQGYNRKIAISLLSLFTFKPKPKPNNIKYMPEVISKSIGTVLRYNGVRLQIVKSVDGCRGCYFNRLRLKFCPYDDYLGACTACYRNDNTSVIFRKIDLNRKENLHKRTKK